MCSESVLESGSDWIPQVPRPMVDTRDDPGPEAVVASTDIPGMLARHLQPLLPRLGTADVHGVDIVVYRPTQTFESERPRVFRRVPGRRASPVISLAPRVSGSRIRGVGETCKCKRSNYTPSASRVGHRDRMLARVRPCYVSLKIPWCIMVIFRPKTASFLDRFVVTLAPATSR